MILKKPNKVYALLGFCFVILFLSSCQHLKKTTPLSPPAPVEEYKCREIEARLPDIPFFVQQEVSSIQQLEELEDKVFIRSILPFSIEYLSEFYSSSMEFNGWELRSGLRLKDFATYYYEKPHTFCSIVLRSEPGSITEILLSTGLQEKYLL